MAPNTGQSRAAPWEKVESSVALERHQEKQFEQEKHSHHFFSVVIQHGEPLAFGQDASRRKVALYPSGGTVASSVLTGREWDLPWLESVGSSVTSERYKVGHDKQGNNSHSFAPVVIEQDQPSTIEKDAKSRRVALCPSRRLLSAVIEQGKPSTTGQNASSKGFAFYPSRNTTAPSVLAGREWNLQLWDRAGSSTARIKDQVGHKKQEQHSHRFCPAVIEQGEPIGQSASIKGVSLYPSRDTTAPSLLTGRRWDLHQWRGIVGCSAAREKDQVRHNKQEQHSRRFCPAIIEQGETSMIATPASVKGIALNHSHFFLPAVIEHGEPSTTGQDVTNRRATIFPSIGTTSSVQARQEWGHQWWRSVESSVARQRDHARENKQEKHPLRVFPAVVERYEPSAIGQDGSSRRVALPYCRSTEVSVLQNPSLQNQRRNDALYAYVQHGAIFTIGDTQPSTLNTLTQYNCIICLDSSILREMKELSCCHKFHKTCIDNWLNQNSTSPVCRKSIPSSIIGTLMPPLVEEIFSLVFLLCASMLAIEILHILK